MASYSTMNTILAAAAEAETPLMQRDIKINTKTLVGGAAVAAFALGALGATAMSSPAAQPAPAALYASSSYDASWTNIELSRDTSKCLAGTDSNVPLSVVDCAPHFGVFEQDRYADGTFTLKSSGLCVTALRDDSPEFEAGQPFGLFNCNDAYADYQLFESTGSELKLASSDLCITTDGTEVLAAVCGGRDQSFRLVQSAPAPSPRPRPSPRPAPRPSSHKYPNGHSCKNNSDCKSGDCHKGDGPYKNKCKSPSPGPSPTKKPTSGPPPNCGRKCSTDSDCAIGGFLQFPVCYVHEGTRCHGYCGP